MTDKPLTEKDFCMDSECTRYMFKKVQSAKRLLKQKVEGYFWTKYDGIREWDAQEIKEMIDACFQIPDGEEAKEWI